MSNATQKTQMGLTRIVRQIQRLRTPNAFQREATVYANAGAFTNPPPNATRAQSEAWACRWLTLYDTAVALASKNQEHADTEWQNRIVSEIEAQS